MATVISRVVAPMGRTEYLRTEPWHRKPKWTEKQEEAFTFVSRGMADKMAKVLQTRLATELQKNGCRRYFFIHAVNLKNL